MPSRETIITRTRAGIVISVIAVVAVAGGTTIIKGRDNPDTSVPVIRITAPQRDQGIFGQYTLAATCKDNNGCTSVVFKVDGTPVGTDTSEPFSVDIDTSDFGNGALTVGAVAEDAAANTTTAVSKDAEVVNGLGKVFVAADGDDSGVNCRRYSSFSSFPADHTTVCESFIIAHQLAGAGDVILVADGDYPAQKVCGGPIFANPELICTGSPNEGVLARTGAAPVTFLGVTPHGAVVNQLLQLGQNNGSLSPINITFDGIDVNGQVLLYNPQNPGNYTYRNMHVWVVANQAILSNPLIQITGAHNMLIQNVELGPYAASGDAMDAGQSVNLTIEDSEIHDLYDSCRYVPTAITDQYGECSLIAFGDVGASAGTLTAAINNSQTTMTVSGAGTINTDWEHSFPVQIGSEEIQVTGGFGTTTWTVVRGYHGTTPASHADTSPLTYTNDGYDHNDGIQAWGGTNTQILRNQWWAIGSNGDPVGQTIFFEIDPTGQCLFLDGLLLENNSIMVGNTNNNTVSIAPSGGAVGCTPGIKNVRILYNTVMNTRTDFSGGNINFSGIEPGTTFVLAGNIIRALTGFGSTFPCTTTAKGGGTFSPTYSHNLGSTGVCGPSDHQGDATFTDANPLDPDMSLVVNGQWALGGGENTYCPATDVVGTPRPTVTPCDVGAYQR